VFQLNSADSVESTSVGTVQDGGGGLYILASGSIDMVINECSFEQNSAYANWSALSTANMKTVYVGGGTHNFLCIFYLCL